MSCLTGGFILMTMKWILFLASGGGWAAMHAGNPGYSRNGKIGNVGDV